MSSFEDSDDFKAAQAAFEKKKNRPNVRNVIERYIDADDPEAVARAVQRGDFDKETAEELGLNITKVKDEPAGDGGGDGEEEEEIEEDGEQGPRRRTGYFNKDSA